MKRENKVLLFTFTFTLIILAAFLWMPMIAGPDGLEQVQFDLTGNDEYEPESDFSFEGALFPDYEFLNINNTYIHSWLIGLIGSIITFGIIFGLLKLTLIKGKNKEKNTQIVIEG
ncbi:PDGLE domain-containing protein [Promethearchaeum syntrophicum]|uniref:PDGLE domain-containing protein n=1 Tax=Promethearchaeum syntrophicum TaxID=2594042 RepID=A0A5B9D9I9_9ARCH|nr:PDGLE domain-containing protein [Candidatus Prometheoarchaeum syntrophicum]QEE15824.1 hypothetical protein DSAG12_01651 [Candidatus Prometheoarchaeum syntrophicum]